MKIKPQPITENNTIIGDKAKAFSESFLLMLKRYIKSPTTFATFLLPLIFILGLGPFMPTDKVFPAIMSAGIGVHAFITYGVTWSTLSRSSLYQNIYTSQYKKGSQYFAVWVLTFSTTIIFAMLTVLFTFAISQTGLFVFQWPWGTAGTPSGLIPWDTLRWGMFSYANVTATLIFTSLAMAVTSITKTTKGYMSIAISYLILQVVFGSLILFPFNNLQEVGANGELLAKLPNKEYFDKSFVPTTGTFILTRGGGAAKQWSISSFSFWVEQFMPTYSINAWGYATNSVWATGGVLNAADSAAGLINPVKNVLFFHTYTTEWVYVTIMPWVWFMMLTILPIIKIKIREVK